MSDATVTVTDHPEVSRYEAFVDGKLAGSLGYSNDPEHLTLIHTEVDDALGGRGVGTALADHAFGVARTRAQRVVVLCSFIAHYVERHPEVVDLLA